MNLRLFCPVDVPAILQLYHDAIRFLSLGDDTQDQIDDWAPATPDWERWSRKPATEEMLVAELTGEIVGFCSWIADGYLVFFMSTMPTNERELRQRLAARPPPASVWQKKAPDNGRLAR